MRVAQAWAAMLLQSYTSCCEKATGSVVFDNIESYIPTTARQNFGAAAYGIHQRKLDSADDYQRCWGIHLPAGLQFQLPLPLMTADMCQNEDDLAVWRACQLAEVRDHVPHSYQLVAVEKVRRQFEKRTGALRRVDVKPIDNMTDRLGLPVLLTIADSCETEQELRAWRAHQIALVRNVHVPPRDQRFAEEAVERIFAERLSQIHALSVNATVESTLISLDQDAVAATALEGKRAESSSGILILLVFGGLSLPAVISFFGGACSRSRPKTQCAAQQNNIEQSFGLQPMNKSLQHGSDDAYYLQA